MRERIVNHVVAPIVNVVCLTIFAAVGVAFAWGVYYIFIS